MRLLRLLSLKIRCTGGWFVILLPGNVGALLLGLSSLKEAAFLDMPHTDVIKCVDIGLKSSRDDCFQICRMTAGSA